MVNLQHTCRNNFNALGRSKRPRVGAFTFILSGPVDVSRRHGPTCLYHLCSKLTFCFDGRSVEDITDISRNVKRRTGEDIAYRQFPKDETRYDGNSSELRLSS